MTLCVAIGMAVTSLVQETSWTQEPPESVVIATDSLLHRSKAAKFKLVLGRLSLEPTSHIKCERKASLPNGIGLEFIEVTAQRGIPSVHYRLETPDQQASVNVHASDRVRIESRRLIDGREEQLTLDQPAQGPVRLSLKNHEFPGSDPVKENISVASLVHLRQAHPNLYSDHLAPLLSRLLSEPPVDCEVDDLLRMLADTDSFDASFHQSVVEKIEQLGSLTRATRNRAEGELIDMGLPILAILDQYPRHNLDAEQKQRLDRIYQAVMPKGKDTKQQLAIWLAGDIRYWNILVEEMSLVQQEAHADRIEGLTGRPLSVRIRVAGTERNIR